MSSIVDSLAYVDDTTIAYDLRAESFESTEITEYHTDGRIQVTGQKGTSSNKPVIGGGGGSFNDNPAYLDDDDEYVDESDDDDVNYDDDDDIISTTSSSSDVVDAPKQPAASSTVKFRDRIGYAGVTAASKGRDRVGVSRGVSGTVQFVGDKESTEEESLDDEDEDEEDDDGDEETEGHVTLSCGSIQSRNSMPVGDELRDILSKLGKLCMPAFS